MSNVNNVQGQAARTLTVHALAAAKYLPAAFLRQLGLHDLSNGRGVGIPYYDNLGEPLLVKRRSALKAGDGSWWPTGKPLAAYGQWKIDDARKQGFVILVEGESDCWTLWHHHLPALGLPGSCSANTLTRELLAQIPEVYIHVEPDTGGQTFHDGVLRRLAELDYDGQAFVLRMPEGVKDPSELLLDDPEQFDQRFQVALTAAKPASLKAQGAKAQGQPSQAQGQPSLGFEPKTTFVASVEPERVAWLWPGRIPLGKLTVLDGDPGLGKSCLTLDLAARLTRGLPMPAAPITSAVDAAAVVLLTEEDGLRDTIRPRLEAAHADLERIVTLDGMENAKGDLLPITLPINIPHIEEVVQATGAKLVIIDPLMGYLDGNVNAHNDQNVRRALFPLAQLAEKTKAAFVVVRHLNKQPGKNVLYRGGGSIGIIGAARSGLMVCKDPEAPHQRLLGVSKCNLCQPPKTLRYELVDANQTVQVHWLEESEQTLDDVFEDAEPKDVGAREEAMDFLRQRLASGPARVGDLYTEAAELRISESTLKRAKRQLGIDSVQKKEGHWTWQLAGTA